MQRQDEETHKQVNRHRQHNWVHFLRKMEEVKIPCDKLSSSCLLCEQADEISESCTEYCAQRHNYKVLSVLKIALCTEYDIAICPTVLPQGTCVICPGDDVIFFRFWFPPKAPQIMGHCSEESEVRCQGNLEFPFL